MESGTNLNKRDESLDKDSLSIPVLLILEINFRFFCFIESRGLFL